MSIFHNPPKVIGGRLFWFSENRNLGGFARASLVFGVSSICGGFVLSYCNFALGIGRSALAVVSCPNIRAPNLALGSNTEKLKLALKMLPIPIY